MNDLPAPPPPPPLEACSAPRWELWMTAGTGVAFLVLFVVVACLRAGHPYQLD